MRTARSGFLETRSARLRLKPNKKPYWTRTGKAGVHLGYRRKKPRNGDANGSWLVRRYIGERQYETEVFADADDFSDADGVSILTYSQAVQKLGAELSELQARMRYTVQNAVDDYLAWLRLNRKTARDAEWKLKHYVLKCFGAATQVSDIKTADFERWPKWAYDNKPQGRRKVAAKATKKDTDADADRKRKATLNRVLNLVKACFNKAFLDGHVASDAAWKRLRRFEGVNKARKHWLTIEQCKRLLNACNADFRRIVQAGLLTGARWSELRAMQAHDFDLHSGTVLIAESKSNKARRIPLTEEGRDGFEEWTAGLDPKAPIFTRPDGKPWGEQDQKRPMAEACAAAKIKPSIGFHTLRHTYASALVQRGVSLAIVAEALGHSDTRMVSEHYGHFAPSHVADAIRAHLPAIGIELEGKIRRLRS